METRGGRGKVPVTATKKPREGPVVDRSQKRSTKTKGGEPKVNPRSRLLNWSIHEEGKKNSPKTTRRNVTETRL